MSKAVLEERIICKECSSLLFECDRCGKRIKVDDEIFHSGIYHTCSMKCMKKLQNAVYFHGKIL